MNAKPFYLSKTFWVNLVALASMAVPQVREFLDGNPETVVGVLVAVNVLLRFATKGGISLSSDSGGRGSSGLSAWVVAAGLLSLGLLPSCGVIGSAITGEPIPATTVQRAGQPDAQPIQIASADLAVAEDAARRAEILDEAPPVHGLYDAGRAAKAAREVFTESSK